MEEKKTSQKRGKITYTPEQQRDIQRRIDVAISKERSAFEKRKAELLAKKAELLAKIEAAKEFITEQEAQSNGK